ncbi:hypothetical protein PQX77_016376 [Marasmius sp. AFHP31]|nr:hypothetical protein PQX77_016376 [Marasmius sp. AFHP31]
MVSSSSYEEPPSYPNSNDGIERKGLDCLDLTASYFVAFHKDRSTLKLASFLDISSARTFYEDLPTGVKAKTLVHKHKIEESTLKTHNASQLRDKCEKMVRDMGTVALDYIVAFHSDGIKQAAFVDLPSAWMFYEAVSNDYAKAVTIAIFGAGVYIKQCEDVAHGIPARLNATPFCKAPYAVAFHKRGAVKKASFMDLPSARACFDTISYSKDFAKVLIERCPSGPSTMRSHGESAYISLCDKEISNETDMTLIRDAPFMVLWHHVDTVKTGFCKNKDDAQALYDGVGKPWSRIILDRGQSEALDLAINVEKDCNDLIRQCKMSVEEAEFPITFEAARYVIASCLSESGTRLAGCMDEKSAQAFYDLVPKEPCKILKRRSSSQELIASEGDDILIKRCEFASELSPFSKAEKA